jgi:hypothetical protein
MRVFWTGLFLLVFLNGCVPPPPSCCDDGMGIIPLNPDMVTEKQIEVVNRKYAPPPVYPSDPMEHGED